MEITSVKLQQNGYLLNSTMSVPMADGNREYELIKQWLAEGNTPEPEYTEEEIAQKEQAQKVQEAKDFLTKTDYKMTVDYYKTMSKQEQSELTKLREEARTVINNYNK